MRKHGDQPSVSSLLVVDIQFLANFVSVMPTINICTNSPAGHFSQASCGHDSEPPVRIGLDHHLVRIGRRLPTEMANSLRSHMVSIWRYGLVLGFVCTALHVISLHTTYICSCSDSLHKGTSAPAQHVTRWVIWQDFLSWSGVHKPLHRQFVCRITAVLVFSNIVPRCTNSSCSGNRQPIPVGIILKSGQSTLTDMFDRLSCDVTIAHGHIVSLSSVVIPPGDLETNTMT